VPQPQVQRRVEQRQRARKLLRQRDERQLRHARQGALQPRRLGVAAAEGRRQQVEVDVEAARAPLGRR